jgi:hypothetical protein
MRACSWLIASVLMVCPALAFAEGADISAATVDQKTKAQAAYVAANKKYEANDMEGALAGFRASFDFVKSPNTSLVIGRALANLGRYAEAYRQALATQEIARKAVVVDKKYAAAETSARDDANEWKLKIAFVRIDLAGRSGTVKVAGRVVAADELGGPIAVDPGFVDVVLEDAATAPESKRADLKAGAEETVSFAKTEAVTPPPPPATETEGSAHPFDMGTGQRVTAGVFLGLGVVGMGLFAGFGIANNSKFSELEDTCGSGNCPPGSQETIDDGRTLQTAANASVIAGSICLAVGAALLIPTFVVSDSKESTTAVSVGPGFVGLSRSF